MYSNVAVQVRPGGPDSKVSPGARANHQAEHTLQWGKDGRQRNHAEPLLSYWVKPRMSWKRWGQQDYTIKGRSQATKVCGPSGTDCGSMNRFRLECLWWSS